MAQASADSDGAINLAHVRPFRLGEVEVHPATRQLVRGGRSETLEPRVMQVLVALAEAQGRVLTRDELIERCWGGIVVGDNAINRVISRIRQIASDFGMDSFQLETITKVGYRMVVAGTVQPGPSHVDTAGAAPNRPTFSRRWVVGGVAAAAVAAGGVATLLRQRSTETPSPAGLALYQKGLAAREGGSEWTVEQALTYFREAIRLDPDFADAWGALALAYSSAAGVVGRADAPALAMRSRSAAAQALRLDPENADARSALILLKPFYRNWGQAERDLRAVLGDYPEHRTSRAALGALLGEVGRWQESIPWLRPLAGAGQFSPTARYRYIYALWNAGRIEEAEAALESAWGRWPKHGAIWQAKVKFLAHTGRPAAALALINDESARAVDYDAKHELDIATIRALQSRAARDIDQAVELWTAEAERIIWSAPTAMQYVASLGRLDVAFALAEGHYLGRGRWARMAPRPDEIAGLGTSLLFNTLTAPMRSDSRFQPLVQAIGLEDYWRSTGTRPDYRGHA